jgi:glutathione S-transferase
VERRLAGSEYLMGSDFTVAGAYLFVVSSWARPADVDFSPYPNIFGLRKRVGARPAVQSVIRAEDEPWPLPKS